MKFKYVLAVALCLCVLAGYADEGMWMLGNLSKQSRKTMKELGLKISPMQIYDQKHPSLKDAIVSFGGFCSGVVVSQDGLVFTNHHCGFSCVQQHSSVGHDYLKDGFVARTHDEELPNPGLYVRFLLRTEDVTRRVLGAVTPSMTESERSVAIDSMRIAIGGEISASDSTLTGVVDAYYSGNQYWLSVYRDYTDVRLVFAPPSSIGKFGWDTDNWVWPRHTGDFCVFRIYSGSDNRPADYSPDNVPYHPDYVAPISLAGYHEGDFSMTLGYPGSTERYLSSYGIDEMMHNTNQAQIDVRTLKQAIWKHAMNASDSIRIKYAAKYDESSNYWKNSIGVNRAIRKLNLLDKKRQIEHSVDQWILKTPGKKAEYGNLFTDLEVAYKARRETNRAQAYFLESFLAGPELIQLVLKVLNFDSSGNHNSVVASLKNIVEQYANLDLNVDKEVFTSMLKEYRAKVDTTYLPAFYHVIDSKFQGNERAYVDTLYARTEMATPRGLKRFLEQDSTYHIMDDPAVVLGIDVLSQLYEMNMKMSGASNGIARGERLLNAAVRDRCTTCNFYPDANSTMRLSFGTVAGYSPYDGAQFDYYTTTKGILEKVKANAGDQDFAVQPEILSLLSSGNFGKYSDEKGDMRVCFITNNDITGGNSGSAMFNAKGELLGLAFDGNWEAMGSDIFYEPQVQRCIGVDIRYILFILEKFGKADHLIKELNVSLRK